MLLSFLTDIDPETWTVLKIAVTVAGALLSAIISMITAALALKKAGLFKWLDKRYLQPRRLQQQRVADACGLVEEIAPLVQRINQELSPNGGESMKDTVNRVDRKVEYLQARFRKYDEDNEDAVFELDEHGRMVYTNPAFCELIQADDRDLKHRDWISHVVAEDRPRVLAELDVAIANKMPIDIVVTFQHKMERTSPIHLHADPHVRAQSPKDLLRFFGTAEGV